MTAAFKALVDESEKRHMPTSYVRDLYYHDRNYLETERPPVFGWMLRDMGTHLFDPRYEGLEWFEAAIKTWSDGLLYWWSGHELYPVSQSELRSLIMSHQQSYDAGGRFKVVRDGSSKYCVFDTERGMAVERYLTEERAKRVAVWCTNNPDRISEQVRE